MLNTQTRQHYNLLDQTVSVKKLMAIQWTALYIFC